MYISSAGVPGTGAGGAEAGGFGGGGANVARDKAERAMAVWGRDTVGNKRSWEAAMTAAGAIDFLESFSAPIK